MWVPQTRNMSLIFLSSKVGETKLWQLKTDHNSSKIIKPKEESVVEEKHLKVFDVLIGVLLNESDISYGSDNVEDLSINERTSSKIVSYHPFENIIGNINDRVTT